VYSFCIITPLPPLLVAVLLRCRTGGDQLYELYSVLIHRGSSMAGHYYAYIKSFETGLWYEFNDTQVRHLVLNHQ
jgi:ubiquitin C-terminal hydrolase